MEYSVIYSVDTFRGANPDVYAPPFLDAFWTQTEGDESYEYGYLGKEIDGIDENDERTCKKCGKTIRYYNDDEDGEWQSDGWWDENDQWQHDSDPGICLTYASGSWDAHEPEYAEGDMYRFGHHRKWCGYLPDWAFHALCIEQFLVAECKTMGSIGAPGFGIGWAPAIAFRAESDYELLDSQAYVTPIPSFAEELGFPLGNDEESWERVEEWVFDTFDYDGVDKLADQWGLGGGYWKKENQDYKKGLERLWKMYVDKREQR